MITIPTVRLTKGDDTRVVNQGSEENYWRMRGYRSGDERDEAWDRANPEKVDEEPEEEVDDESEGLEED